MRQTSNHYMKKNKSKNPRLELYKIHKHWDKGSLATLNQEEVEYRLYNNLPVDDLYDNLKFRYDRKNKDNDKRNENL